MYMYIVMRGDVPSLFIVKTFMTVNGVVRTLRRGSEEASRGSYRYIKYVCVRRRTFLTKKQNGLFYILLYLYTQPDCHLRSRRIMLSPARKTPREFGRTKSTSETIRDIVYIEVVVSYFTHTVAHVDDNR